VPVDWNTFRGAMRRFATGVAILTVRDGDAIHGMTPTLHLRLQRPDAHSRVRYESFNHARDGLAFE